ncbi:MAG: cell division protein SepF [Lachnospiraceae bacterium]|nr:cell division protein SepF [Lachnospiraceae bacterium]
MAKFLDKMMTVFSFGGNDEYDDEEDIYDDDYFDEPYSEDEVEEEPIKRRSESRFSSRRNQSRAEEEDVPTNDSYVSSSRRERNSRKSVITRNRETGKVVALRNDNGHEVEFEIQTQRPKNSDDSAKICDIIKEGKPVLVNLEGIGEYEAQRIIDIVSGCVYAMDGDVCKASLFVLLFTPGNVEITGELTTGNNFSDTIYNNGSQRSSNW